jgi:hypothetical protein
MFSYKVATWCGAVLVAVCLIWVLGLTRLPAQSAAAAPGKGSSKDKPKPAPAKPMLARADQPPARLDPNGPAKDFVENNVVIPDCRLSVIDKAEISSQREGVVLYLGHEIQPGEEVPPDRVDSFRVGKEIKKYWRLKEGDLVEENQQLAQIDDRLARDESNIKDKKLVAADADHKTSIATRDEAKQRYETQVMLYKSKATSQEEVRGAKLAWDKYIYEVISKKAAIEVAKSELAQTRTVLELHEIRSPIRGRVQIIYKKKGEEVKNLEPILLVRSLDTLQAEGSVDTHYLPRLSKGMKVLIEPMKEQGPFRPFIGHMDPVTGVAVSKDSRTIVSCSDDKTVRVWERGGDRERRIWQHPAGVRAVACTPKDAAANLCLSGCADGSLRLWDLGADSDQHPREFEGKHGRPVNCVAFNHDGTLCASGGDDNEIRIWNVSTGQFLFKLTEHYGPITSLQFTSQGQLVSVAKDNTIKLWSVNGEARPPLKVFPKRSGDVTVLGVSPNGDRVLYDDPSQNKTLRILSLPQGLHEGIIRNPSPAASSAGFKTLALFSPDGRLILTGEGQDASLQLWKAPTESSRAFEVRRLVTAERAAVTCAAFAPDGSFVVAGTKERQVLVWGPLPSEKEVAEFGIPGVISNIDKAVDPSGHKVRIFAEFINPKDPKDGLGQLMPMSKVNMVVPPRTEVATDKPLPSSKQ